jgi:hypothetical protein
MWVSSFPSGSAMKLVVKLPPPPVVAVSDRVANFCSGSEMVIVISESSANPEPVSCTVSEAW